MDFVLVDRGNATSRRAALDALKKHKTDFEEFHGLSHNTASRTLMNGAVTNGGHKSSSKAKSAIIEPRDCEGNDGITTAAPATSSSNGNTNSNENTKPKTSGNTKRPVLIFPQGTSVPGPRVGPLKAGVFLTKATLQPFVICCHGNWNAGVGEWVIEDPLKYEKNNRSCCSSGR